MDRSNYGSLIELVDAYIHSEIGGEELVRRVDDIVGNDVVLEFPEKVRTLIYSFQDDLAYYVKDEQTWREAPEVYFRDEELLRKAEKFLEEIRTLIGRSQ